MFGKIATALNSRWIPQSELWQGGIINPWLGIQEFDQLADNTQLLRTHTAIATWDNYFKICASVLSLNDLRYDIIHQNRIRENIFKLSSSVQRGDNLLTNNRNFELTGAFRIG